jgi:hypothetical protein
MSISTAQFQQWLKDQASKIVVLAEVKFAYELAGNVAEGAVYLSTGKYTTLPSDSPANQTYHGVIQSIDFAQSLDVDTLGGQAIVSVSSLKLDNLDGALDFLENIALDGREVRFYLGDRSWPRSDFQLALVAVAEWVEADDKSVTINLRDKRLLLDREIKGDAVGGTGPNATKYMPLVWGSGPNLEPLIYDTSTLEYAALSNYGAGGFTAIVDVRDGGVSLSSGSLFSGVGAHGFTVDAATDTFTKVAHGLSVNDVIWWEYGVSGALPKTYLAAYPGMAARPYWVVSAGLTADNFRISATKGGATLDITGTVFNDPFVSNRVMRARFFDDSQNTGRFQLSSSPAGRITCDVYNYPSGFLDSAPFALAKTLILTYGNVDASQVDAAAFTAADVALDLKVNMGYTSLVLTERQNLLDALDSLVDSCFGWHGVNSAGLITCGLIDPSGIASATATRTLAEGDVLDGISVTNQRPTYSRVNVNYQRNYTVQADGLFSSVSDANRTKYSQPYGAIQRSTAPSGTAYATNKPLYHKTMTEGAPQLVDAMDSTAFGSILTLSLGNYADEIVADRAPNLKVLTCDTGIDKYDWALGDPVRVTYPRHGLNNGVNCRVIGRKVDLVAETVSLTLLAQITPDYTTASHG